MAALAGTAVLVAIAGGWIARQAGFGWPYAVLAIAIFAAIAGTVLATLKHHGHNRFGPANLVTTLRAGFAALMGAAVIEADRLLLPEMEGWVWGAAIGTGIALALDGVDGQLARRRGLASRFGAGFDMETDALLILFLSALAYGLGKAGPHVLLIGLMRYLYLLAQFAFPVLRAPLPPAIWRKGICVLQVAILCLLLTPVLQPPWSEVLADIALVALIGSFGADILALTLGRRRAA